MLKVVVIGGGSTYPPELVNGFLARLAQFPLDKLWLMDIDEERLRIADKFVENDTVDGFMLTPRHPCTKHLFNDVSKISEEWCISTV